MNICLYDTDPGSTCVVTSVPGSKLLECIGVFEGVKLRVDNRYSLGGPVAVSVSTRKIAIGKEVAEQIMVSGVEK